jgi:hypothetical protein
MRIEDPEIEVPPNPVGVGKLKLKKRITGREIEFLKRHAPGTFKTTIPSPATLWVPTLIKIATGPTTMLGTSPPSGTSAASY